MVIKTKFGLDDEVFFIEENKVASSLVVTISVYVETNIFGVDTINVFYRLLNGTSISGKGLYGSKEELLENL